MGMNKRQAGGFWEEEAAAYLQRAGVRITARNFKCSRGEIDIIGFHRDCLVFFEVKYRRDESFGTGAEAVGVRKQERICRTADVYLYRHPLPPQAGVRFDVVAVCGRKIEWLQGAFDYRRAGAWRRG
ncbi:MAG: YraN family protein [Eubacteriales bacterium]|nr:YraN family protein [Eubacteriales bacterium]